MAEDGCSECNQVAVVVMLAVIEELFVRLEVARVVRQVVSIGSSTGWLVLAVEFSV